MDQLRKGIEDEIAKPPYPIPGVVALLGSSDRILYHEAFGLAQVEPECVAMRRDSIFDVASLTKVVATATAAAICVDRGLIDPDAPMTRYLSDHQGRGVEKISLRLLASHMSGFHESPTVAAGGNGDAMFEAMLRESPAAEPGTRHLYACRNLILLSTTIERVTGEPFGEFCIREIFAPLGMTETVFNHVAPSSRVVGTFGRLGVSHNSDTEAAGRAIGNAGLFTTAADLACFCQMMLGRGMYRGRRLISEAVIADFTATRTLPQFPPTGFVWKTGFDEPHHPKRLSAQSYGHGGYTGQALWIDPERKLFTILLSNRNHPRNILESRIPQYETLGRIADMVLESPNLISGSV